MNIVGLQHGDEEIAQARSQTHTQAFGDTGPRDHGNICCKGGGSSGAPCNHLPFQVSSLISPQMHHEAERVDEILGGDIL